MWKLVQLGVCDDDDDDIIFYMKDECNWVCDYDIIFLYERLVQLGVCVWWWYYIFIWKLVQLGVRA